MTSRKRSVLAVFSSMFAFGGLLFMMHAANFYSAGTSTFRTYCQEHQLDSKSFVAARSGSNLGYSFMDYARSPVAGTPVYIYHVTIPWVGAPKVAPL